MERQSSGMSERRSTPTTPSWEELLDQLERALDFKAQALKPAWEEPQLHLQLVLAMQLRELLLIIRPLADHPLLRRFRNGA